MKHTFQLFIVIFSFKSFVSSLSPWIQFLIFLALGAHLPDFLATHPVGTTRWLPGSDQIPRLGEGRGGWWPLSNSYEPRVPPLVSLGPRPPEQHVHLSIADVFHSFGVLLFNTTAGSRKGWRGGWHLPLECWARFSRDCACVSRNLANRPEGARQRPWPGCSQICTRKVTHGQLRGARCPPGAEPMKSHSRRAAPRGQAGPAQSCGCQDPRPETERPAGCARSSGEAREAPCLWPPSGTCGPPPGRRPHPWGSPLLLLAGAPPGPGGPLLPRSTALLLAGGHTHAPAPGSAPRPPTQQPPPRVSTGSVTPLFCLKVLPDFSKPAAPMFLASVAAPSSPGPARPHLRAVSALCRPRPSAGLPSPVCPTLPPGSASLPLPGKAS